MNLLFMNLPISVTSTWRFWQIYLATSGKLHSRLVKEWLTIFKGLSVLSDFFSSILTKVEKLSLIEHFFLTIFSPRLVELRGTVRKESASLSRQSITPAARTSRPCSRLRRRWSRMARRGGWWTARRSVRRWCVWEKTSQNSSLFQIQMVRTKWSNLSFVFWQYSILVAYQNESETELCGPTCADAGRCFHFFSENGTWNIDIFANLKYYSFA